MHYSRREALALSGVIGVAVGSGCLGLFESVRDTRIDSLLVSNFTTESRTIHLEILHEGEPELAEDITVPEATEDPPGRADIVPGEETVGGLPDGAGPYVLQSWTEREGRDTLRSLDLRDYDHECVEIMVQVGDPFQDHTDLSIWRSFDCSNAD